MVAFLYKIPLGSMRLLGDEGFAHFTVAYNIYGFILTLATAGFPVALSRMISVADAREQPARVQRTFRVAMAVLTGIGGVFTLTMLLFNRQLAAVMGDREAALSIAALAPAVVIVCATSAYRGYCQGRGNMIPTAFGQVVEEVGKLIIGLSLAWVIADRGLGLARASAGAIFGVTAGALAALTYMALYKRRNYPALGAGVRRSGQPRLHHAGVPAHRHPHRAGSVGALDVQSAGQRAVPQPPAERGRVPAAGRPYALRRIR